MAGPCAARNVPAVRVAVRAPIPNGKATRILIELSKPANISELQLLGRRGYGPRNCKIQLSLHGDTFHTVKEAALKEGEPLKATFEKQSVKFVRLLVSSAYDANPVDGKARNVQVAELFLPGIMEGRALVSRFRPIKDLKLKSATRELGMSAPDCRFLLNSAPTVPGELAVKRARIINISDKMDDDGTLRWNVHPRVNG